MRDSFVFNVFEHVLYVIELLLLIEDNALLVFFIVYIVLFEKE